MAMIDQEDELATNPTYTPVGPTATPRRMNITGVDTSGMTAPETQQTQLTLQTDPRYRVYAEKARMRTQNQESLRLQSIQQAMQRHEAFSDLEGVNPPHENRISLHTPTGYTHDGSIGADWQKFSPEMRAVHEGATKQFNKELSQLLGGSDQSAWATTSDYEQAIQSLPSVRKYGSIIEGYARNTALRQLAPEMQAKFKANDQNFVEFQKWYRSKGFGAGGQSAEAAWDEMHGTGPFAGQPTQRGSLIAQQYENDPSVKKFDVDPATLQLRERPLSQQQRLDMQLQQQGRMREAEEGPRLQALTQQYESLPPEQKRLYMKPIAGDKELREFPKAEKPKEQKGYDDANTAKAVAEKATRDTGTPHEVTFNKDGRYDVEPVKDVNEQRLTRASKASMARSAGQPVVKTEDGVLVTADDKEYRLYTDAYVTRKGERKKVSGQMLKDAIDDGEDIQYELKPQFKSMEWNPKGAAAEGAPSTSPSNKPASMNDRGWKLHRDAKGNMAYVGPNGEVEEVR